MKGVFLLPIPVKQCELPIFLKDKKYADLTESYSQGLQDLILSLIPKNASSLMLNNLDELQPYLLPAFSHGELVTDHDLNRVMQAINVIELRSGLPITDFNLMRKCQVVGARYINQLMDPINAIIRSLDLADTWEHHMVRPGQMYTVDHMNEL